MMRMKKIASFLLPTQTSVPQPALSVDNGNRDTLVANFVQDYKLKDVRFVSSVLGPSSRREISAFEKSEPKTLQSIPLLLPFIFKLKVME